MPCLSPNLEEFAMNVQSQNRYSIWGITLVGLGLLFLIHQFVVDRGMALAHDLVMVAMFGFVAAMTYVAYTQNRHKRWLLLVTYVTGVIAGIILFDALFSRTLGAMQYIPLIMILAGIYLLARQFVGRREPESQPLPPTGPEADKPRE
jgi:uncharacterized membrane protein HdeD (DUF308 family)